MRTEIDLNIMNTVSFVFRQLNILIRRCIFIVNKFSLYMYQVKLNEIFYCYMLSEGREDVVER